MNPYIITWVTLIPVRGIVTKKDAQIISGLRPVFPKLPEISFHNATKEKAIEKINSLRGKLSKKYIGVIYTDKQFGMRKFGQPVGTILTSKQKAESFEIK